MVYDAHAAALARHLEITPFLDRLRAIAPERTDRDIWFAVLTEAARMAESVIAPIDPGLDREGARLVEGRVRTAAGHAEAWRTFADNGWIGLALPEALGGQGQPLVLQTACEELFNRASPAFSMLPTPNRTAAALLHAHADADVRDQWMPKLISGAWGATICISEPDAGSDVGRIRTRATLGDDGVWRIEGTKCWISYGDHDLTQRIGHFMLARSSDAPGVRGLSLFLVPDSRADGSRNGVTVERIEEKLGLHGSPTCVLSFADAEGVPIGPEGRGLQTLFAMMLLMRLSCGPQGVGVGSGALAVAKRYALERRQGGDPKAPPVPIADHADVQRMLLEMGGRIEVARGISLAAAAAMDLSEACPDAAERDGWLSLAQFLLPIAKDWSARLAFDVASGSVQVLGGAGYTREWPVERSLRDARVFAVFEGTSGIQAIDMLHRRLWREKGEGIARFMVFARADCGEDDMSGVVSRTLDRLQKCCDALNAMSGTPREAEAGASAFLELVSLAVGGWIALRLHRDAGDDATGRAMRAGADFFLHELDVRSEAQAGLALLGEARLSVIADFLAA